MNAPRRPQLWPLACVTGLLALAFAPQSFLFDKTDWELVYVPAAERYLRGESVFNRQFVYPPAAALPAIPSALLGEFGVRVNVWLMNTFGATALVAAAWWLAGGRFAFRHPPREWAIAALGLPAFLGAFFEVMVNRQNDLLVGGLAAGGAWLVVNRHRDWLGGGCIGLAAALKCTPLLFAPYLFWVGRWKAGTAVLLAALLVNLAPDLIVFPPSGRPRVVEWVERTAATLTARSDYEFAAEWSNHSLAGLAHRLAAFRLMPTDPDFTSERVDNPPPPRAIKLAVYGTALALLTVTAVVVWRGGRRAEAFGVGAVFCLMLLLSPMSSKPHFCVLAVPAWAVARAGVERRRWELIGAAGLAGVLELLAAKDLVGGTVNAPAMWYGCLPAGVFVLFVGCLWARWATSPLPAGERSVAERPGEGS